MLKIFGRWCQRIHRWHEEDEVITFNVTSNGMTGPEWIECLEKKGFQIGDYTKSVLRSPNFKPTNGVMAEIAVLKGMLFGERPMADEVRTEADRRGLIKPNPEVACLIRENFSNKEIAAMGLLWIVAMHEPIKDYEGKLRLLLVQITGFAGSWLGSLYHDPKLGWFREDGFAFIKQVSS